MSWESKVIWSEGMFLQPQHFQQHERYLEKLIEARARPTMPHAWGFATLEIDEAALAMGKLALSAGQGLFPDGTPFDFPATHQAPPPLDIPPQTRNQLVLIAVPLRRRGGSEVEAGGSEGLARYAVANVEVPDITSNRSDAIQLGELRLCLLLENEKTDAFACLGVLRVAERRADNQLLLDQQYIPPALSIRCNRTLAAYCDEIHGLLHQRGEELAAQLAQPGRGGVAEIADFLLLQTVNRHEAVFAHFRNRALLHPEHLFMSLLALAGDLATFGNERRRVPAYPEYRHDSLELAFLPLMTDLRRYLSMVLQRSAVPIALQVQAHGVRHAVIPDRNLIKSASFVLAVNAHMPADSLRTRFPSQVKFGPVERLPDLVNLALPGLKLRPMPVAPRQIPYHAGFNYFELERGGDLWQQLEHSAGLAMHIAGDFPGLELELWAIKG